MGRLSQNKGADSFIHKNDRIDVHHPIYSLMEVNLMNMKWTGLTILLILAFVAAACAPKAAVTPVMEDEKMEDEMMEEDEEMKESEDEMTDDEEMEESEDEMMEEEMVLTTFVIRIENIGDAEGLTVLAPGAYELNDHAVSFFTPGEVDRGEGLEALAEDGDPSVLVGTINQMMADMDDDMDDGMMSFVSNVFNTPVGADAPGPAGPGAAYEFSISAYPGQYLTFATMFVHSNDWFFAPDQEGINLFDADGIALNGDITEQVYLWNAGTEVDQTPGEGADQPPSQSGPNTGEAENGVVELVEGFSDYQILVTITPQ